MPARAATMATIMCAQLGCSSRAEMYLKPEKSWVCESHFVGVIIPRTKDPRQPHTLAGTDEGCRPRRAFDVLAIVEARELEELARRALDKQNVSVCLAHFVPMPGDRHP